MTLTLAQKQTLKAAILADPVLAGQPMNSDGSFAIAAALNAVAVPTFFVWRSSVPVNDIMRNGFDWTRVDNLTIGKARIWDWMMRTGVLDPSQANVRAGVLATFGVAADLNTRLAVFTHFQRAATRLEQLFAVGSGTAATEQGVGPATMVLEGAISYNDVQVARES